MRKAGRVFFAPLLRRASEESVFRNVKCYSVIQFLLWLCWQRECIFRAQDGDNGYWWAIRYKTLWNALYSSHPPVHLLTIAKRDIYCTKTHLSTRFIAYSPLRTIGTHTHNWLYHALCRLLHKANEHLRFPSRSGRDFTNDKLQIWQFLNRKTCTLAQATNLRTIPKHTSSEAKLLNATNKTKENKCNRRRGWR